MSIIKTAKQLKADDMVISNKGIELAKRVARVKRGEPYSKTMRIWFREDRGKVSVFECGEKFEVYYDGE